MASTRLKNLEEAEEEEKKTQEAPRKWRLCVGVALRKSLHSPENFDHGKRSRFPHA